MTQMNHLNHLVDRLPALASCPASTAVGQCRLPQSSWKHGWRLAVWVVGFWVATVGGSVVAGDVAGVRPPRVSADRSLVPSDWRLERLEFPLCLDQETWLLHSTSAFVSDRPAGVGNEERGERSVGEATLVKQDQGLSLVEREILESVCEIYHHYGPQSLDGLWFEAVRQPAKMEPSVLGRWMELGLVRVSDTTWLDNLAQRVESGWQGWAAQVRGVAKASPGSMARAWSRLQADLAAVQSARPVAPVVAASSRSVRAFPIKYVKPSAMLPQVDPSDWLAPQHSRAASLPNIVGQPVGEYRATEGVDTDAEAEGVSGDAEAPVQRLEPSLYWEVFERRAAELGARLRGMGQAVGGCAAAMQQGKQAWTARVAQIQLEAVGDWAGDAWTQVSPWVHDPWEATFGLARLEPQPTASYVGLEQAILVGFRGLEQVWSRCKVRGRELLVRVVQLPELQNSALERMVLERIDAIHR